MFNYNNLSVTLRVSPEISSANFYTKEESKELFIQDVPQYADGSVYGRTNGNWVKIDGSYNKLRAGFSVATTTETLISDGNFDKLGAYAYVLDSEGTISGVKVSEANTKQGNALWLCLEDEITSITTNGGLPITVPTKQTVEYDGITYNAYEIEGLDKGQYTLSISIAGQSSNNSR